MRILILSQRYYPEPLPKPSELAEALSQRGHSVTVITGFPHYPERRLYPGYRLSLAKREIVSGIPVVRTFVWPYHGRSAIGRVLNYVSFMCSSVLGSLRTPPCDLIYVWHPPLTVGLAAWAIARLKRAPYVYDVQDIWPESAVWSGMLTNQLIIWCLHQLERFVYDGAKHILVVSSGAKDNLQSKGVPSEKISVARHWVDESIFNQPSDSEAARVRLQYHFADRFVVMFAGNLGIVQGLEAVIRAAELLREEKNVLFVFVGDGSDKPRVVALTQQLRLTNVLFVDRQPMAAMPAILGSADALLVHLKRSRLAGVSIPTKTLAYLASGRPIIMGVHGAAADLVRRAEAGIVVAPDDPQELARAVLELYRLPLSERMRMGQNGRAFLLKEHSKESVLDEYEAILVRHSLRGN